MIRLVQGTRKWHQKMELLLRTELETNENVGHKTPAIYGYLGNYELEQLVEHTVPQEKKKKKKKKREKRKEKK
jgi:hypothetical protein